MEADLHVHTTASDGMLTPYEAVREAALTGLSAVGITDHDSAEGIQPALKAGSELGIEVVPGIEINTDYEGRSLHILGYYLDFNSPILTAKLNYIKHARILRVTAIVEKLKDQGFEIHIDDVMKLVDCGAVGRPHIALALYKKGLISSPTEAFRSHIGRGRPAFVPRYMMTPIEAVSLIREAKGIPVFAHPGTSKSDHMIPELISAGLMGLEVYHPEHRPETQMHYLSLTYRYRLLVTGGSDSHGPLYKNKIKIGEVRIPYHYVDVLKERKSDIDAKRI